MTSRSFRSMFLTITLVALFGHFYHVDAQSGVDPTYIGVPSVSLLPPDNGAPALRQAVQADGKILVWGGALAVEGIAKGGLALWYLLQSTAGFGGVQWGVSTDVVIPNAFAQ